MRRFFLTATLIFLALPSLSYAACSVNGCTSKIDRLYVTEAGHVYIKPVIASQGIVDCTLTQNTYFRLERTHVAFNELYSLALSAKMADKNLFMRIKNGSTGCHLAYFMLN